MNHSNFEIFERNYLLRQIRYDTQIAYLERNFNQLLIQAINRISCLQNLDRFKKLDDRQWEQVRRNKIIQDLYVAQQSLSQKIYNNFDTLKKTKTKSSSLHVKYFRIQRLFVIIIRIEERSLFKAMRQKYDKQISIDNIERQLNDAIIKTNISLIIQERSQFAFLKRSRIKETLFFEKSSMLFLERNSNWRILFINDLIALCERCERCISNKRCENRNIKSESDESKKKKFTTFELYFVRCKSYQCLFCLSNVDLTNDDRRHDFVIRYSLKRHLQRYYVKRLQRSNDIYCSHSHVNCVELIFKDSRYFKNYVVRVHFVKM